LPPQPLKTEEPEEKITESSSNGNGHNGNGKGNGKTDHALESPTEVPLKRVLKAEEKVLEPERTVE
jgi:hypothetical protein